MKEKIISFCLIIVILTTAACTSRTQRQIDNVTAFSHVYGLVRWYHPSDEAQQINWNKFAMYGVHEVADCRSEKALCVKLEELFRPIAPTISFSDKNEIKEEALQKTADTSGMFPVAWQHYGVDLGGKSNLYESIRINRPRRKNITHCPIGGIIPSAYWNKKLKITARLRIIQDHQDFKLYLLFHEDDYHDVKGGKAIINDGHWQDYEYESSATNLNHVRDWVFYTEGKGSFYIKQITLSFFEHGKWVPFFSFDYKDSISKYANDRHYNYKIIEENALKISTKDKLFDEIPRFGEYINRKISKNMFVHLPLVLYGNKEHTYPAADTAALNLLKRNLAQYGTRPIEQNRADIVVAWNVMKYFHPYLADMPLDWDDELRQALARIGTESKKYDTESLDLMLAKIEDGHIFWTAPYPKKMFPFVAKKIKGEIMAIHPLDSAFQRGDIIKTINGKDALKIYKTYEARISGSADVKNDRARIYWNEVATYQGTSTIDIKRNGEAKVLRAEAIPYWHYNEHKGLQQTREINDSTLYVNLYNTSWPDVQEQIENRKPKQKIIFDMRHGSSLDSKFYALIPKGKGWPSREVALIPQMIYPCTPVLKDTLSTIPHKISNRNIFIMGIGNQSHHETFLDMMRYYGVACLVGTHTAGANGNINYIPLPGGVTASFTGMKFLSYSGKDYYYYRKGIQPDYPVEETINDIKSGRDAAFEKALAIAAEPTY